MKKFLIGSSLILGIPTIGITGATFYLYPELKDNYSQIGKALQRIYRVTYGGVEMVKIYRDKDIKEINEKHQRASKILRDAFKQNAGIYIKFGQLIASLDYIVPDTYRETFAQFLDQCPQTSFEQVKQEIEGSTGLQLNQIFKEFSKQPISSASIAQVHSATLLDGQKVAVKIQHPWLRAQSNGDIKLIEILIDVGEYLFPEFRYKWFAEELREHIPKELDFNLELENMKKAARYLNKIKKLKIPKTYDQFCNDRIITMEFIDGILLTEIDKLKNEGYDLRKISTIIALTFTNQIFKDGFVHSDPHQGNIMVQGDCKNPTVVLIDHGLYQTLDDRTRLNYNKLWKSIIEQNEKDIMQSSYELGVEKDFKLFSSMITSKPYETIMDDKNKNTKKRLGRPQDVQELEHLKQEAMIKHQDIVLILNQVNRYYLNKI